MDLETMRKSCQQHGYHNTRDFQRHVELIVENCTQYNGKESPLTKIAHSILDACKKELQDNDAHLAQLEQDIARAREHMRENEQRAMGRPGSSKNAKNMDVDENAQSGFPEESQDYEEEEIDVDGDDVSKTGTLIENKVAWVLLVSHAMKHATTPVVAVADWLSVLSVTLGCSG
ncbi:putative transcription initiation factor TFIID subunit 1 [Apostichopus japonicus]|uniref:Putative transcription initiation factor TFIID subunit 1 n=1 Tax=Stichopus japonicus TaxID=307972 RepID=A0A2G8JDK8_STIJA|nr:putative transcription initiation factor TFIID subunit 1 [Apostichopus japonicus]